MTPFQLKTDLKAVIERENANIVDAIMCYFLALFKQYF